MKSIKIFAWFFSIIIFLSVLLIALLPSLLSTQFGKQQLLSIVNSKINGNLHVESVHLSWFGKQSLSGLELKDTTGTTVVHAQQLNTTLTLVDLLLKNFSKGSVEIHPLNIHLYEMKSGITNLEDAVNPLYASSNRLTPLEEIDLNISVQDATLKLTFQNNALHFLANGNTVQNNISGSFDVDVEVNQNHLDEFLPKKLKANISHFPTALLDELIAAKKPGMRGFLPLLLGNTLDLSMTQNFESVGVAFSLAAESSKFNTAFSGTADSKGISLTQPGQILLKLSPQLIPYLENILDKVLFSLKNSIDAKILIQHLMVPYTFLDPSSPGDYPSFNANIFLSPAIIDAPSLKNETMLEEVELVLNGNDSQLEKANLQLKGKISQKDISPILLKANGSFEKPKHANQVFDILKNQSEFSIELDDASTQSLEKMFHLNSLEEILGPKVSFHATVFLKEGLNLSDGIRLNYSVKSDKLSIPQMECLIKNHAISTSPAKIRYRFNQNEIVLDDFAINIENNPKELLFHLKGKEKTNGGQFHPLLIKGSCENVFPLEQFDITQAAFQLDIQNSTLPVDILCEVSGIEEGIKQKILALFGTQIRLNAELKMRQRNGLIKTSLRGENGSLFLDGKIANGILTLNAPFEMTTTVTPQLGTIFEDLSPLLKGIISADAPIKILIDQRNFSCPVTQIAPEEVKIELGTIHLGKMVFANEGQLRTISNILAPSNQGPIPVWFTPLYFHMHLGKLIVERMDLLLLDRYPLAIWGNIHFPKDKVDMKIGISGMALANSIGVKGLDKNDFIQIPFKGSLRKASIDKGVATAKIGSLVAQTEGSSEGLLIGTVLGIASGSLVEEKAPPPTTNPLPWASMVEETREPPAPKEELKEKKSHKKKEKIGKKIREAATSIVNEILK